MRVLFLSEDGFESHQELLDTLVNKQLAILDKYKDLDEAEYCIGIRAYDFIIIDMPNSMKAYFNILRELKESNKTAKVFFLNTDYKKEDFAYYIKDNLFFSTTEGILLDLNLPESLTYKNVSLKILANNKIEFTSDEKTIIEEFNQLEFLLIIYFIRHYGEVLHIDRLIAATLQEPEFEKKTSIESSISSIKKTFRSLIDVVPIINIKKKGYVFQY